MLVSFETFIEKANRARTTDELVTEFLSTVKKHGYDRMIFCLQSPHDHLNFESGVGVIQNYPEDWMKYYFEKKFDQIDPVITYCQNRMTTFTWAEIPERMHMTKNQFQCLNMGIEAGLYNGICSPLWGPNQFAGVGLATSGKADSCDNNIDLIQAYCNHFYTVFQRINRRQGIGPEKNIYLTVREREILTWAATGKTDSEIASILNMSEHTVDTHLRHVFTKLGANTRSLAITKALSIGLIRP